MMTPDGNYLLPVEPLRRRLPRRPPPRPKTPTGFALVAITEYRDAVIVHVITRYDDSILRAEPTIVRTVSNPTSESGSWRVCVQIVQGGSPGAAFIFAKHAQLDIRNLGQPVGSTRQVVATGNSPSMTLSVPVAGRIIGVRINL